MKAMIFAAGIGSRLRPLTDTMPKALVPIAGKPMLEHVLMKLKVEGVTDVLVNTHHFSEQIVDFVNSHNGFGMNVLFSDESQLLLETGGGLKRAAWFFDGNDPFVVHNVDILCDVSLQQLLSVHKEEGNDVTLLMSKRSTQRYLLFDNEGLLQGRINKAKETCQWVENPKSADEVYELAFSGIHICSPKVLKGMLDWPERFSIMDYYLEAAKNYRIAEWMCNDMKWIDIGKMDTVAQAEGLYLEMKQ